MLKCLAFLRAVYDCRIRTIHVAGVNNLVADPLSYNRAESGPIRHSQASPTGPHTGPTSMGESDLPASFGLGIRALESNFQSFLEAGITESTMKVYRAGWSRYQTFTNQFEIASTPVTLEKMTLFVAYLSSKGWQFRRSRYFRIQAKPTCMAPLLHSPCINLIIKGIKLINSAKEPTRVRLPITATLMGESRVHFTWSMSIQAHSLTYHYKLKHQKQTNLEF